MQHLSTQNIHAHLHMRADLDLSEFQFSSLFWQKIGPAQNLQHIKLLALDVDGVLTNGQLHYSAQGEELKTFNTLDGHGIKQLQKAGIGIAIITGRGGAALQKRMADLGTVYLFEHVEDKEQCLRHLLAQLNLNANQVAYMGDDEPDLSILTLPNIGLAVCPQNAHISVKKRVDVCIQKQGGQGAVRALCDLILGL